MNAPHAVAAVEAAVRARTGLVLEGTRRDDLESAVREVLHDAAPEQWAETLRTDTQLFDRVVAAITIGETYFFRDPDHFAYLRDEFLPALRAREPGRTVEAWSAGCSTGEEAYSLAILFDQAATPVHVLATDISRTAIAKAKAAVYGRWSLRGDAARLVGEALRPASHADTFAVIPRIKERVRFAHLNLVEGNLGARLPARGMDVILCRNVLIYLEPQAIRRVARRLFDALADGGVLITGPSDPLLGEAAPFVCDYTPSGVRYTKGPHKTTVAAPALPEFIDAAPPPPPLPPQVPAPVEPPVEPPVLLQDETAELTALRAQANSDATGAVQAAAAAAKLHPKSREIPFLEAILLMNLGRLAEAEVVLRRLIYLDPSLAVAHFALGNLRLRSGDLAGARRAFKAAGQAASALPADEVLALSDGETAGQMVTAAARLTGDDKTARGAAQ